MKHIKVCSAASLLALFFLAACGGSSAPEVAAPTPVFVDAEEPTVVPTTPPAPTPEPDATPTAEPVVVADEDLIALAVAAFEANPDRAEIVAVDLVEGEVREDGRIELVLCTWTGDTVYTETREVIYDVGTDRAGQPALTFVTGAAAFGDCLNEDLMQSALAFTREFDSFYAENLADPAAFAADERGRDLLTPDAYEALSVFFAGRTDDDLDALFTPHDQPLPESALAEIMWRRYETDGLERFGVVACRDMNASYGLYRDSVLVDDGRGPNASGNNSAIEYILEPASAPGDWQLTMFNDLLYADCFGSGDWPEAVNDWRRDPARWEPWQR